MLFFCGFTAISYTFKRGKKTTPIQMGIQIISVSKPIKSIVSNSCNIATKVNNNTRILSKR
jgi:hypothetical protein